MRKDLCKHSRVLSCIKALVHDRCLPLVNFAQRFEQFLRFLPAQQQQGFTSFSLRQGVVRPSCLTVGHAATAAVFYLFRTSTRQTWLLVFIRYEIDISQRVSCNRSPSACSMFCSNCKYVLAHIIFLFSFRSAFYFDASRHKRARLVWRKGCMGILGFSPASRRKADETGAVYG